MKKFSPGEIEKIDHYVYVYLDPRNDKPFYIGMGKGNRAFDHLKDQSESEKAARIREIRDAGLQPKVEILVFGLDRETALKVEAAAIDLIGAGNLTNRQKGHGSNRYGRRSIDAIHAELDATPVTGFPDNMVLIKINHSYADTSDQAAIALYDATRGCWRMGMANANKAEYAAAVYGGVVREVYKIAKWLPAGSTQYADPEKKDEPRDRIEFVGRIADETVRKRYRWKSVAHLYLRGAANPIFYVGPAYGKEPLAELN